MIHQLLLINFNTPTELQIGLKSERFRLFEKNNRLSTKKIAKAWKHFYKIYINKNYTYNYEPQISQVKVQPNWIGLPFVSCIYCYAIYNAKTSTSILDKHYSSKHMKEDIKLHDKHKTTNIKSRKSFSETISIGLCYI